MYYYSKVKAFIPACVLVQYIGDTLVLFQVIGTDLKIYSSLLSLDGRGLR